MYFFPDVTGRVAAHAGMRAVVGLIVIDFPSVWAENEDSYFSKGIEVQDHFRGHPLVRTAFAPHAPYTVSDEPLKRILTLSDELDLPVHMHVHETDDEIQQSLHHHQCRPIERLERLGLINPMMVGVHMTHLQDDEIERFALANAHVVHCPESNMKLASGFCPTAHLFEAGINVALGTDGAASNNDHDMIGEMRTAALLGKAVAGDACALPAEQVLRMATINGAKALGLDAETGSLEAGKAADIVAVDMARLNTQPLYNPLSQLVYSCGRDQVSDVWIQGRRVLRDRDLTTIDRTAMLDKASAWVEKIAEQ